jgi:hypothetical protein
MILVEFGGAMTVCMLNLQALHGISLSKKVVKMGRNQYHYIYYVILFALTHVTVNVSPFWVLQTHTLSY